MNHRRIYLAAPIFTPDQLAVVETLVMKMEATKGIEVFSPYHNSREIWRGRAPSDCSPSDRGRVLTDNIEGIEWCDYLFAWVGGMGGFTDPGVVWEMGYAAALAKAPASRNQPSRRPFTVAYLDGTDERPNMNLMLAGTVDAVVRGYDPLPQLFHFMQSGQDGNIRALWHPDYSISQEKEPIV